MLKQLRLSGVLETLEVRSQQAILSRARIFGSDLM
jgi:hypothetical protein